MPGPAPMDEIALLRRFLRAQRPGMSLIELQTALGVSRQKFYELRLRWVDAGLFDSLKTMAPNQDALRCKLLKSDASCESSVTADVTADVKKQTTRKPVKLSADVTADGTKTSADSKTVKQKDTSADSKTVNQSRKSLNASRERASARPQFSTSSQHPGIGSSLRSEQAAAPPASPSLENPTDPPEHLAKVPRAKLADGTVVRATWTFANALRLNQADMKRLLEVPGYSGHRTAIQEAVGRVLESMYIARWCEVYERPPQAYAHSRHLGKKGSQATAQFKSAAMVWARIYADRGLTLEQFLDAAHEMRPKSMKFPTPAMLSTGLAGRIAEWQPLEERNRLPSNVEGMWTDSLGKKWIQIEGVGPVRYYDGSPGNK